MSGTVVEIAEAIVRNEWQRVQAELTNQFVCGSCRKIGEAFAEDGKGEMLCESCWYAEMDELLASDIIDCESWEADDES